MSFEVDLKKKISDFESGLDVYFKGDNQAEKHLNEAMQYSLLAGGKRLRPLLLLEIHRAYGGADQAAMPFACAIEMIHTYSLIHDDLPCMDDDDLRRGKPTNHVVYGEDMAVLSGDALLNLAAETMADAVCSKPSSVQAMREILRASGYKGMILGQVADMKYQNQVLTTSELDFINAHKTGKLITASLVAGALLAEAPSADLDKLEQIGDKMGLIFQMVDDCLDLVGDANKLGKRIQMDIKNEKCTYPILIGLEETHKRVREFSEETNALINQLSVDHSFLKDVLDFFVQRDY